MAKIQNSFKKILLGILVLFSFSYSSFAQKELTNEISIEYSQMTVPQGIYLIGGAFGAVFTLGNFNFDNTIFTGALGIEYNTVVTDWFSYGGYVGAEYITSDTYTVKEDVKTYNGQYKFGCFSLMPTCHFIWFNNDKINLYSKLGLGVGLIFDNGDELKNNFIPTFQISPICVDFGSEKIKGLCELGFGMQGIVTVGIKKMF